MQLINTILGRPFPSGEKKKTKLTVITGVPLLGLDAFASTAYGPEAALLILLPLSLVGLQYFFFITLGVITTLIVLYLSYRQIAAAYPEGAGAYIVASANLGSRAGLCAAISLLFDYLLNVAVGISAGIGAVVSALPFLQPYTLLLCLSVLFMLTVLNLRGVRETGLAFIVPTGVFVLCISFTVIIGFIEYWFNGAPPAKGHPSTMTDTVSTWILLGAFANGLTAMTGIEAVSNAVPLFHKPVVRNAQRTLTVIVGILCFFLLAVGYLCPAYHIMAMQEGKPGYQTILSQLVKAVAGEGVFYYLSMLSIFIVLTYSAQTSFVDFPRVCHSLAEDSFIPRFFANRGQRLVYSYGIITLAFFSAILLITFEGVTYHLIPLFAIGAFSAFLFSQTGMIMHWLRKGDRGSRLKLFFNALGAMVTAIALFIIVIEKFTKGAWIVIIIAPALVMLLTLIRRHYAKIDAEVSTSLKIKATKLRAPLVIIPINGWDRVAEKALRFGFLLSNDVIALYIDTGEEDESQRLMNVWAKKVKKPAKAKGVTPQLKIINSPYRRIYSPILNFVKKMRREEPNRLIAVVIPELVEPHWYEYLLHNIHAAGLRALLFLEHDPQLIVISTPWYLFEKKRRKRFWGL